MVTNTTVNATMLAGALQPLALPWYMPVIMGFGSLFVGVMIYRINTGESKVIGAVIIFLGACMTLLGIQRFLLGL